MGKEGYGAGMKREEVKAGWAGGQKVYVIPVVNVEVFVPGCGGPAIQPHLQSVPELANRGWRDYGNRRGLQRLASMFKDCKHSITWRRYSRSQAGSVELTIAAQSGIEAFLDFVDDDVPYYITHEEGKRTLCLPYCMETNDISLCLTKHFDGRQYSQEDGEKVVCLGMHTFIAGTPARALALTEVLGRLQKVPGVCFATAAQVASAIQKQ
eukprot:g7156.t1